MARFLKPDRTTLRERLRTGDTYVLLLALLFVDYFAISLIPESRWTRVTNTLLIGITLILALHTSHARGKLVRLAIIVYALGMVVAVVEVSLGRSAFVGSSTLVLGVMLIATPFVILRRILRHPQVDIETVVGAIDVYLLIGITFWALYATISAYGNTPFFNQLHDPTPNQLLYFSFVTLTTLGYGDLTPATNMGRSLVVFEAVIGQIFLVTLVARIVALFGSQRVDAAAPPDAK